MKHRPEDGGDPLLDGFESLPEEMFALSEATSELRARILSRTSALVGRRRWRGRVWLGAAAIVVFAFGVRAGQIVERSGSVAPPMAPLGGEQREHPVSPLPRDPRGLEERILASGPEERVALLRDAGDRYLSGRHGDPEAALYCYARLLKEAASDGAPLAPTSDDTWLLTYLKLANSSREELRR